MQHGDGRKRKRKRRMGQEYITMWVGAICGWNQCQIRLRQIGSHFSHSNSRVVGPALNLCLGIWYDKKRERFMGLSFLCSAFYYVVGCLKLQQVMMMKSKTEAFERERVTNRQKRRERVKVVEKPRGVSFGEFCFVSWGKKRSEERQIRGQCLSGLLKLCLMSGGFCGFFSMHVLWLYLVPSYGRSSWVRRFDHFSCFTRPINK